MLPKILMCFWEDLFQSPLFRQRGFILCASVGLNNYLLYESCTHCARLSECVCVCTSMHLLQCQIVTH